MDLAEFTDKFSKIILPQDTAEDWAASGMINYYWNKYRFSALQNPRRIAEIGVRAGYSAWAFLLAAPTADYIGFDPYLPVHGGFDGSLAKDGKAWAEQLIGVNGTTRSIVVKRSDEVKHIDGRPDFVHVDGDHSHPGCASDMLLACNSLAPGGLVLIDDYSMITDVRHAVDEFIQLNVGFKSAALIEDIRGQVLLFDSILPDWVMTQFSGKRLPC